MLKKSFSCAMEPFRSKYFNAPVKPHHYSVFYNNMSDLNIEAWHEIIFETFDGHEGDTWIGSIIEERQMIVVSFGNWDVYFCFRPAGKIHEGYTNEMEFWLDSDWDENLLALEPEDFPEIDTILELLGKFKNIFMVKHNQ